MSTRKRFTHNTGTPPQHPPHNTQRDRFCPRSPTSSESLRPPPHPCHRAPRDRTAVTVGRDRRLDRSTRSN